MNPLQKRIERKASAFRNGDFAIEDEMLRLQLSQRLRHLGEISRERPQCPIVALSPIEAAGRKLSVVWGIHCVIAEDARDQDDMVERACQIAFREGFAKAGQRVIIVAGVPLGTPGATNFMRIAFVGADAEGE